MDPALIEKQERFLLADRLAGWREKYPELTVRQQVVRSRPTRALLELGLTAQLVVVEQPWSRRIHLHVAGFHQPGLDHPQRLPSSGRRPRFEKLIAPVCYERHDMASPVFA